MEGIQLSQLYGLFAVFSIIAVFVVVFVVWELRSKRARKREIDRKIESLGFRPSSAPIPDVRSHWYGPTKHREFIVNHAGRTW